MYNKENLIGGQEQRMWRESEFGAEFVLPNDGSRVLKYIFEKFAPTKVRIAEGIGVTTQQFHVLLNKKKLGGRSGHRFWSIWRIIYLKRQFQLSWTELGAILDQVYTDADIAEYLAQVNRAYAPKDPLRPKLKRPKRERPPKVINEKLLAEILARQPRDKDLEIDLPANKARPHQRHKDYSWYEYL